jgi:hypothetical protein
MSRKRYNNRKSTTKESTSKVDPKLTSSVGVPKPKDEETNTEEVKSTSGTSLPTPSNDPEWYSRDARLLADAASIPFSTPFGAQMDFLRLSGMAFPGGTINKLGSTAKNYAMPGVCTLRLKPSMGNNLSMQSPANICANALYAHVRYVNNGRKNYDPADLFMYASFFGDMYSFLVWCVRLYNYAFMYSQRNWYVGRNLIMANGVDPDDLVLNLANFRYWINSVINKISSYAVPSDIYYFKRRAFLYANYYIENPYNNLKDQLYQFVPDGFYKFDFDSNGAGKLSYLKCDFTNPWKLNNFAAYFNSLMQNVTGDEDFGLMSGDILKAYGANIIRLSQVEPEAGLLPVYDQYVLSQFKNAVVCGGVYRGDPTHTYTIGNDTYQYGDVCQAPDGVITSLETCDWANNRGLSVVVASEQMLTVETPEPNIGDVVEASRLHTHYMLVVGTIGYVLQSGTEIVVGLTFSDEPNNVGSDLGSSWYDGGSSPSAQVINVVNATVSRMSASFKYAPVCYKVNRSNPHDQSEVYGVYPISNIDNYTMVTAEQLSRINECAMLSLFYVPGVAKLV